MQVDTHQPFLLENLVRKRLADAMFFKYLNKGVLVQITICPIAKRKGSKKIYSPSMGPYIPQGSLENFVKSPHINKNARQRIKSLLKRHPEEPTIDNILLTFRGDSDITFHSPEYRGPTNGYDTRIKVTPEITRSAGNFFDRLRKERNPLSKADYKAFAFALWNNKDIGIHPFTTEDGTWCYTKYEIDAIMHVLKPQGFQLLKQIMYGKRKAIGATVYTAP